MDSVKADNSRLLLAGSSFIQFGQENTFFRLFS
jgi:hypothetical protein